MLVVHEPGMMPASPLGIPKQATTCTPECASQPFRADKIYAGVTSLDTAAQECMWEEG
jgi:hypothetical protein